jgi:hypothetical protein
MNETLLALAPETTPDRDAVRTRSGGKDYAHLVVLQSVDADLTVDLVAYKWG